jgi:3-hydroxyisobutyrate dehydrogenase-like beta-hydroxyacid dehydrogenase
MSNEKPRVGCIGVGVLGSAIMRRLIDCGFAPVLWNRDRSKLAELLKQDATEASSPAQLARSTDFIITCVSDGSIVEHVVFGKDGVAESADKVLVDMSTCATTQTQAMAKRLADQCGMALLDSPISGGAPAAREGTMAIMVGGDKAVFERARPLWDALAGRATLMGPNGAGQATKMQEPISPSLARAMVTIFAPG